MKGLKVPLKDAQKVKDRLAENGLLRRGKLPVKEVNFIIFPIKNLQELNEKLRGYEVVEKQFKDKKKPGKLRDYVLKDLTEKEKAILKTSFDVVGSIAILEVPEGLGKKQKSLAEILLKLHPRIKTVLKKEGGHTGVFRKQKMKLLAGEDSRETIHKENKVRIKVNVETVYFSARLSGERKRIAGLVKKGEKVLVMFSGAGPYVCAIAKNSQAKEIVGVEINPEGHRYAMENLLLNKIKNARLYLGDVKKVVPTLKEKFDRIVMPLPKTAGEFLPTALSASKKGTIIHFYEFLEEKDIPGKAVEKIEKACEKEKMKCKVKSWVKCGQQSPRVWRVCVDFKV